MLSDLLLPIPLIFALYLIWRGRDGYRVLSLYLLSGGMAASLKLLFRIPRSVGLDPFSFPSLHAAVGASLFFSYPHPLTFLYAVLMGAMRILEGYHGVTDVLGGFGVALVSWVLYRLLRERIGYETDRKSLHYGIAVLAGFFMLFVDQVILSGLLLLAALLVYTFRELPLLRDVYGFYSRGGRDYGPITLAGGLFLGALAGAGPLVGMILGYVDVLASLFGKLTGSTDKSIPGLAGGVLGGLVTLTLLSGYYPFGLLLSTTLFSPLLEYTAEADDNLALSAFVAGATFISRVSGLYP